MCCLWGSRPYIRIVSPPSTKKVTMLLFQYSRRGQTFMRRDHQTGSVQDHAHDHESNSSFLSQKDQFKMLETVRPVALLSLYHA